MAVVVSRSGDKEGKTEYSVKIAGGKPQEKQIAQELVANGVIEPLNAIAFGDTLLFGTDNDSAEKARQAARLINARVKELRGGQNTWPYDDHP